MDYVGKFHIEENDGKLFLVYHHPKCHLIPQIQSPTSSNENDNNNHFLQPLFLCPYIRYKQDFSSLKSSWAFFSLISSPKYIFSTNKDTGHSVLPLFWCNNKESDVDGMCYICYNSYFSTDFYFCESCGVKFHKECVQSPLKINHPYHPQHFLRLCYQGDDDIPYDECLWCGRQAKSLVYHCNICKICMHPVCAMKEIPFIVDQSKSHDHPLTFFPRQASLVCNVCGLVREFCSTYVCLRCNFVAHRDCMYSPHVIKISRHHHRISYISSLQFGEWSCKVCRQNINGDYGAYTCNKCKEYVVHSRCALGKDGCDGVELEGVTEEDDITEDDGPFDIVSEKVILYFLHEHHLHLKIIILYDENQLCQACVLPIFEGNFYSCIECDFVIHETCVNAPRRIQHALHPHTLTLKADNRHSSRHDSSYFRCNACDRAYGGFGYQCPIAKCEFHLDVRCASISEPFDYEGHEHPLFMTLNPLEKPICHMCKHKFHKQLNCIKCNFIVCMECATLPYKIRYKHDIHFLTILYGERVHDEDWCEVCERNLKATWTKMFYWCNKCCTTFHIECIFGEYPYMKPGQFLAIHWKEYQLLQIHRKRNISRPLCDFCKKRCHEKIFKKDSYITCSVYCGFMVDYY